MLPCINYSVDKLCFQIFLTSLLEILHTAKSATYGLRSAVSHSGRALMFFFYFSFQGLLEMPLAVLG